MTDTTKLLLLNQSGTLLALQSWYHHMKVAYRLGTLGHDDTLLYEACARMEMMGRSFVDDGESPDAYW